MEQQKAEHLNKFMHSRKQTLLNLIWNQADKAGIVYILIS